MGRKAVQVSNGRILIVDDEQAIRITLRLILEHAGYEIAEAAEGTAALDIILQWRPDLALLDIKMPGMDGMEVLKRLCELPERPEVIMLSGHGAISTAVEASKLGAFDFLEKPPQKDRILLSITNALRSKQLQREAAEYRTLKSRRYRMVGNSAALQQVREQLERVAGTHASVLITGESGTGKELIARELHEKSQRKNQAFVHVNCAAIPETLIENELFGHERGAYTGAGTRAIGKFEQADRGTIFLDEIGDMSLYTQAKVLRILQDGQFQRVGGAQILHTDVRVVSATNKDLLRLIRDSKFREDLYFRLNVVPILAPPLREHAEDIPDLVAFFIDEFVAENGIKPPRFHPAAIEALQSYHWPGNVRELKNIIERLLIMGPREEIKAQHILLQPVTNTAAETPSWKTAQSLQEFHEQSEKAFLLEKLRENAWNVKATAKAIKTPRSNLYKKLSYYDIKQTDQAADPG